MLEVVCNMMLLLLLLVGCCCCCCCCFKPHFFHFKLHVLLAYLYMYMWQIKIPQQDFALKRQGGGLCARGGGICGTLRYMWQSQVEIIFHCLFQTRSQCLKCCSTELPFYCSDPSVPMHNQTILSVLTSTNVQCCLQLSGKSQESLGSIQAELCAWSSEVACGVMVRTQCCPVRDSNEPHVITYHHIMT